MEVRSKGSLLAQLKVWSILCDRVLEARMMDVKVGKVIDMVKARVETSFQILEDGMIVMKKRIYLHDNKILKTKVLKEAYESKFVIYPGSIKI